MPIVTNLFRNSYSCTQCTWFVWYVYIFSLIRLEITVFRYSQLSFVQVSILVGIWIIEAGLSLCFISSFLFHIHREIFWRNMKPERLVPVLLTLGSKLGKRRKLTAAPCWRIELAFTPLLFWIQSSTMDACHSSRSVWTASPVMLIDLFRTTVRAATFLHLNICSKLREKYSKASMLEIAWDNSHGSLQSHSVADKGAVAAQAAARFSLMHAVWYLHLCIW